MNERKLNRRQEKKGNNDGRIREMRRKGEEEE